MALLYKLNFFVLIISIQNLAKTSLLLNSQEFFTIQEESGNSVILGCRPTSPTYHATLYDNDDNEISHNPRVSFDPKLGFIIKNFTLRDSGYYRCVISLNDNEENVDFHLRVIRKPYSLNQPKIMENSSRHVVLGQELRVNCTIDIDNIPFSMNWTTPQQTSRMSTNFYRTSIGPHLTTITVELVIKDVAYEDEGEYKCFVRTLSMVKTATTMVKLLKDFVKI